MTIRGVVAENELLVRSRPPSGVMGTLEVPVP